MECLAASVAVRLSLPLHLHDNRQSPMIVECVQTYSGDMRNTKRIYGNE